MIDRIEAILINHKKTLTKNYKKNKVDKNCLFFSDQMYRRFNKNDTNGDQMQEKHSV